jgi:hypothetical protein
LVTTPTELTVIRDWWASNPESIYPGRDMHPIAGSANDQPVPDGIENPYWEIIRQMPAVEDHRDGVTPYGYARGLSFGRHELAQRYSWSIPSPGDIAWLRDVLDGQGVVEGGAGSGYWAWQMAQAGTDVVAYEPNVPADNQFVEGTEYFPLNRSDTIRAVKDHPGRALMLCWPNYSHPWAAQALTAYKGDLLIYIGEGEGGCCADDDFFELLDRNWVEAGASPHHVTWWGIHCRMTAYRRV